MGHDVVSQACIHNIVNLYRIMNPQPTQLFETRDRVYELIQSNIPCRIFNIEEDNLKNYDDQGEYKFDLRDIITKYPIEVGDILYIEDEVRKDAYYVKSSEFLSLEPYVYLFKHYQGQLKKYSGDLLLNDGSTISFPMEFYGVNTELS